MKGISKRPNKIQPKDEKVIISSEYFQNDRPSYICDICNQTLVRLTDAGMNNQTYWCRHCSVEWDPTKQNIRRESKLSVPDRNIEPSVTSINFDYNQNVAIRHEPDIKGAFKELKNRGLKITNQPTTRKISPNKMTVCYHCDHDIYPKGKPLFDLQADNAIKDRNGNWKCSDCVRDGLNKEILWYAPGSPAAREIMAERRRKEESKARYERMKKIPGERLSYYHGYGWKKYRP